MSNSDIPVKEIGEMLDLVAEKLPRLIKELFQTLYSQEGAERMSQAAGTFYKNLIDAGMEKQDALYLTEEYLNTIKFVTKQYGNS
ncbi:MAG: hypothetical protein WBI99_05955 [Limnochordia bacterium]|nr:hypothetical protein [Limnochordia bacterium]MDI9465613.1 hypothetical protein [Bacillota bacterium]NLO95701.1 hypothetical protein [Bacillota bacterium]HAI52092.1 hypothetical protein [Bacillota bacterium]HAN94515.1 hypothetical protein [Bacillota bacterium]